jgi:hypothetical protein
MTAAMGGIVFATGVLTDLRRRFREKLIIRFTTEINCDRGRLVSGTIPSSSWRRGEPQRQGERNFAKT